MPTEAELNDRPELLMGPNPLIECAEPFIPFEMLPIKLECRPLEGKNWRRIQPEAREALLDYTKLHFVATGLLLDAVAGIQRLFRGALMLRNPLQASEQLRTTRVATALGWSDLRSLPALDGAGGMWAGPTGMGKSTIAHRALEVICPNQVIVHEPCPRAGWLRLVQCCYLYVDQPSNGSRGGLLHRILVQLDRAIGTEYSDQHRTTRNLDVLLVTVSKLLVVHRVALLVIDEKQSRNFLESPWQIEFVLFYLNLMNSGISVLLLGNPIAFDHLKCFSQVMRRFSVGGIFDLCPARQDEPWWSEDFVPRKQEFSLVEECSVSIEERAQLSYAASGGNPGLFEAFHTESQRCALRRGGQKATLTRDDFAEALKSPNYTELELIAKAHHSEVAIYADLGNSTPNEESTQQRVVPTAATDVVMSLLGRYRAEQTRATNILAQKMKALKGLSADDLRILGATEDMLGKLMDNSPFAQAVERRKSKGPRGSQ